MSNKVVNIRMSYDTTADIESIVEKKVSELTKDSMVYKSDTINSVADLPLKYNRGYSFRASEPFEISGYYADNSSYMVERGDLIIANTTAEVNAFEPLHWDVYQANIEEPIDAKYTDIIDGNF